MKWQQARIISTLQPGDRVAQGFKIRPIHVRSPFGPDLIVFGHIHLRPSTYHGDEPRRKRAQSLTGVSIGARLIGMLYGVGNSDGEDRPITDYGWAAHQAVPLAAYKRHRDRIDDAEAACAEHLVKPVNTVDLDPCTLTPTQSFLCVEVLDGMSDAEDLPPIIVLAYAGKLFIHDGHHRATRALLRGCAVAAVVVNLE